MSKEQTSNVPVIAVNHGVNLFDSEQFATLQRVCKAFASSDLVPDIYRTSEKNPESKAVANCMIAIDMAQRLSANPLMVMQNLYVVQGKPSWSSTFLISTVNTCGRFDPLRFTFKELGYLGMVKYVEYEKKWVQKQSGGGYYQNIANEKTFDGTNVMNYACVAYTNVCGSKDILESTEVTVRMALQEGWYTKSGSKWPTMTKQMLMYRAAAFWVRTYAPELSMGMRTVEENQDIDDQTPAELQTPVQKEIREEANKEHIRIDAAPAAPAPAQAPEVDAKEVEAVKVQAEPAKPAPVQEQPLGESEDMPEWMRGE